MDRSSSWSLDGNAKYLLRAGELELESAHYALHGEFNAICTGLGYADNYVLVIAKLGIKNLTTK